MIESKKKNMMNFEGKNYKNLEKQLTKFWK